MLTTARLGGFDMIVNSFAQQTMPDSEWELIIVDEYFDERHDLIKHIDLPIKHIPPYKRLAIYDDNTGLNSAIRVAEGELITVLVDYCWVYPGYLQTHWDWYKEYPGYSMTGYLDRYVPPPIKTEGDLRWSAFKQPFDAAYASEFFANETPEYCERKGGYRGAKVDSTWEMPGELIYMLGDSIPLSVLKELNGWDEAYNGAYGTNDIDLCIRANMLGWKFILNENSLIWKTGTQQSSIVIPAKGKPKVRKPEDNRNLFMARMQAIREGKESVAVPHGRGAWR